MPIPPELDTDEFREAWAGWKAERVARKQKLLTPRGEAAQLKHLAKFGPAVAVEAIEASTRNNWIGLFPEKVNAGGGRAPASKGQQLIDYAVDLIEDARTAP